MNLCRCEVKSWRRLLPSSQILVQNAFGYVLPIASFVLAWLETWFLDFKVLTQEADEERGEGSDCRVQPELG